MSSLTPRSVDNRARSTVGRGGNRYLTRDEIIAIYLASGQRKNIAADFEVTESTVCHIKLGHRHLDITAPYRLAAKVNATLVTMACGVNP
jgi:hypothetical protein